MIRALRLCAALALALQPLAAWAQSATPPPAALTKVGIDEHLGAQIPTQLTFITPSKESVPLSRYLNRGKPVILTLVYYDCPMICGLLLQNLATSLKSVGLTLGKDYEVLSVSFNPLNSPRIAGQFQQRYLQALGQPQAKDAWTFLVGEEPSIQELTKAVGFRYTYDERTQQYAHLAAIFVLTPSGVISRYLYGMEYPPRDLKLALLEASGGKVGTTFDRVLLSCYQYDPASRRYAFFVNWYFKIGGLLVLAAVSLMIVRLVRWERRKAAA